MYAALSDSTVVLSVCVCQDLVWPHVCVCMLKHDVAVCPYVFLLVAKVACASVSRPVAHDVMGSKHVFAQVELLIVKRLLSPECSSEEAAI